MKMLITSDLGILHFTFGVLCDSNVVQNKSIETEIYLPQIFVLMISREFVFMAIKLTKP